jgi:CheY-like chemotaxis protein/two-component sensor histidine kinase
MHVLDKDSRVYEYMEEIVSASSRAKDLVNQILNFSRSKELGKTTFSLSTLLKESMKLFRAALPDNYKLKISVSNNAFPINADPTKVTQIIFNLCTNAFHAMEEMETGKLSIDLDFADESDLGNINNIIPDTKYVRLKISDTGTGIPFEIQDKIFDPFFTTKDSSKGTGLGLHMVKQLIEEFDGALSLISIINEGTSFYIYLPISKIEMAKNIKNEKSFESGSGNIMIIDDNDSITKLLEKACKNLGYNTIAEKSSKQALYIYEFVAENVDIAIIDLLMPEMNGPALLHELRKFNPELPAIFISGSNNVLNNELSKLDNYEFILKPVMISDLSSKIKAILKNNIV